MASVYMIVFACVYKLFFAIWFMRSELRAVHEYQADSEVLASGASSTDYRMMLMRKAYGKTFTLATESLNSSPMKKRLKMMQNK